MSLTKATYSMITGAPVNVLDYMTPAQIADVLSNAGTIDVTTAVQSAFTVANGTQSVYFPDGSYVISSPINCEGSSVFGESMYGTKILCHLSNARALTNLGRNINNLSLIGTGYSTADGIEIQGYLYNINNCYFWQLRDSICPTSIIVTTTVNQCLFLGCNSAINDKLCASNPGTAHTTLNLTSNSIQYGNYAFYFTQSQAAGFYIAGNVFEQIPQIWYGGGLQTFSNTWIENWFESVSSNMTIFNNVYSGGTDTHISNHLNQDGSTVITDSTKITAGQYSLTGQANGNGGGFSSEQINGTRICDFSGFGFIYGKTGILPASASANYTNPNDLIIGTMNAASNQAYRGGDAVATLGSGSFGQRNGALRSAVDNNNNLGDASYRWGTVYAGTGTINTSDANQKQQFAGLTTAEQTVAKAIKGLIKTFKFNDAVAKKGANARTHIGVSAQEVQAVFIANGLDASKYGLFCSDTWYTLNGEIVYPNTSGIYPEGAVKNTQLGIRYDELICFVIGAM